MSEDKVKLALVIQFGGEVQVSDDYQLGIPNSVHISQPRQVDPKETPFMVMTAAHWNAFQKLMDELGVREEFKRAHGLGILVPVKNVVKIEGAKIPIA